MNKNNITSSQQWDQGSEDPQVWAKLVKLLWCVFCSHKTHKNTLHTYSWMLHGSSSSKYMMYVAWAATLSISYLHPSPASCFTLECPDNSILVDGVRQWAESGLTGPIRALCGMLSQPQLAAHVAPLPSGQRPASRKSLTSSGLI